MSSSTDALVETLQAIVTDVSMLKSAFSRSMKVGPVEEIDAEKGYRLNLGAGPDGKPFLSPWYPHPETGKTSIPLAKGQIVGVVNPNGDPRQGFIVPGGYSDGNPSPNQDMEANVFSAGGVTVTVKNGSLTIKAGGVTFVLSPDGLSTTGGRITHDEKDIGSTHKHGGIFPGNSPTDVPIG